MALLFSVLFSLSVKTPNESRFFFFLVKTLLNHYFSSPTVANFVHHHYKQRREADFQESNLPDRPLPGILIEAKNVQYLFCHM